MHHRDRATPIALPRKPPIAQAILGDTRAPAGLFCKVYGSVDRLLTGGHVQTREMVDPFHLVGLGRDKRLGPDRFGIVKCQKRVNHRQVIFAAEIEVTLVMRRAGEDRAGAVIHQDEIGDPDG